MKLYTYVCVTLLCIATSFTALSMQPAKKMGAAIRGWTEDAFNIITSKKTPPLENKNLETTLIKYFNQNPNFARLAPDTKTTIIGLIITGANGNSLEMTARTINSLAQINKEMNKTLNNRSFCLNMIKELAQRFNTYDLKVCDALQTPEAREISKIQRYVLKLVQDTGINDNFSIQEIKTIFDLGMDINFTYDENQNTLLLFAIPLKKPFIINTLLTLGADPEKSDKNGETPLEKAESLTELYFPDKAQDTRQMIIRNIKEAITRKHQNKLP